MVKLVKQRGTIRYQFLQQIRLLFPVWLLATVVKPGSDYTTLERQFSQLLREFYNKHQLIELRIQLELHE